MEATTTVEPEKSAWPTPKEVATARGISVQTIYGMIRRGVLRTRPKFGNGFVRPPVEVDPASVEEVMSKLPRKVVKPLATPTT